MCVFGIHLNYLLICLQGIQPEEITFIKEIGKGSYGTVHLGTCRGISVAIKQLNTDRVSEREVREFKLEASIGIFIFKITTNFTTIF